MLQTITQAWSRAWGHGDTGAPRGLFSSMSIWHLGDQVRRSA